MPAATRPSSIATGWSPKARTTNVFCVRDGTLLTPPFGSSILRGVTRGQVLDAAAADGIPVREAPVGVDALQRADEIFITSSRKLVAAIGTLDDRPVGAGAAGPVTKRLFDGLASAAGGDLRGGPTLRAMTGPSFVALNVGNTRTQVSRVTAGEVGSSDRFANHETAEITQVVIRHWPPIKSETGAAVIIASVNDAVADRLASALEDQLGVEVYRVGTDLPVPIAESLGPETITGVDRLLNACAAYDRIQEACIVIDAGSAVTVDFVDGEGTYFGGAIAPGARLQLRALHEHTASLPEVEFRAPDAEAFGRSTVQAMLQGVYHGIRGLVWRQVERYAERYGAFPQIIATGGDADILFRDDELINAIVPDLTVLGMVVAGPECLQPER